MSEQRDPRLDELLADQAVGELSPEEQAELERLLVNVNPAEATSWEQAATAIVLSQLPPPAGEMPQELLERLRSEGEEVVSRNRENMTEDSRLPPKVSVDVLESPPGGEATKPLWLSLAAQVALAASILVAAFFFVRRDTAPTVSELFQQVARAPDVVRVDWTATEHAAAQNASGEVLWSTEQQAGVMVFRGLPANDPAFRQYQLWIFDDTRDERYPVDGGVFDIDSATGEVRVPIRAKLAVRDPKMFAITIEPTGGVVVSSREELPLLATVPKG